MFPKVAPDFFKKRSQGPVKFTAEAAAPAPAAVPAAAPSNQPAKYVVNVNGADYTVVVSPAGVGVSPGTPVSVPASSPAPAAPPPSGVGTVIPAPVAGTIIRYVVGEGTQVTSGTTVIIIESMKMELEIKATTPGKIHFLVPTGTQVASQQPVAEIQ